MINTNCIDHIKIDVLDIKTTTKWYAKVFGFVEYDYCIIGNKNIKLCLYHADKITLGSIDHFGFNVIDYDAMLKYLKEIGISLDGEMYWEYSRSAYILDPNGYRIELSEQKGGGYDLPEEAKMEIMKRFMGKTEKEDKDSKDILFDFDTVF
ncbi:MAG: VOC family protein [Saprospiraceae bacterium]|nr:VOC family protein [Saprospiraceae bacterium]